jgi:hypothetical protein
MKIFRKQKSSRNGLKSENSIHRVIKKLLKRINFNHCFKTPILLCLNYFFIVAISSFVVLFFLNCKHLFFYAFILSVKCSKESVIRQE